MNREYEINYVIYCNEKNVLKESEIIKIINVQLIKNI